MHNHPAHSAHADTSRWRSFTDKELYAIEYGLDLLAQENLPKVTPGLARSLSDEVEDVRAQAAGLIRGAAPTRTQPGHAA
jgi:hypothetical protein